MVYQTTDYRMYGHESVGFVSYIAQGVSYQFQPIYTTFDCTVSSVTYSTSESISVTYSIGGYSTSPTQILIFKDPPCAKVGNLTGLANGQSLETYGISVD